ncbi:endonuclease/exonuclease/phosphatase family protein [Micromonospora sp. DT229]|uniref:endonuclease/exonuclease/phosphatase family protein n=1 Tax=Micromonospora sp. DT229 TaxID=3393430 RepID=UPI003CF98D43
MTTAAPAETRADQAPSPHPPRRRWAGRVLVGAAALWLVFTLAHRMISGRSWLWLAVDTVPPLAFLLVPLVLGLGATVRRHRRAVALLAAAGLLLGAGLSGVNLRWWQGGDGAAPPDALRIFSWNTGYWDEWGETEALYRVLREADADVYLLQEYWYEQGHPTEETLARLRAEFPEHQVVVLGELVTLSRVPVLRQVPVEAPDLPAAVAEAGDEWRYKALRTDLDLGAGRVLSAYNVHLPVQLSPEHGPFDGDFYRIMREQRAQREPQWRALARDVRANPHPVLLAGDLNTTPAMGDLRKVPEGLRDAKYAMSSPYPASWAYRPEWPHWWRLDWAFVSPQVRVHDYRFGTAGGASDHRPQELRVSLS